MAALSAVVIVLVVKLVKSANRHSRYVEYVRIHDSLSNEAIDLTVGIVKELLDLAVTSSFKPDPFTYRLTQRMFVNPNRPESIVHNFDHLADCRFYGVLTDLRSSNGKLSDEDILFCSLICFDFSPAAISMLYNHTNSQSYYNRRSRLRKRLGIRFEGDHIRTFLNERIALLSDKDKNNDKVA